MKLKTTTHDIKINSFTGNDGLTIYAPIDTNLGELRTAVQTSTELSFYTVSKKTGEEKLSAIITGEFVLDTVSINNDHIKIAFKKTDSELAKLAASLTDLELALCEIYENMEV